MQYFYPHPSLLPVGEGGEKTAQVVLLLPLGEEAIVMMAGEGKGFSNRLYDEVCTHNYHTITLTLLLFPQ